MEELAAMLVGGEVLGVMRGRTESRQLIDINSRYRWLAIEQSAMMVAITTAIIMTTI